MPAAPVPLEPRPRRSELQPVLGVSLWQAGPYLGLYRDLHGNNYVVCAVVSASDYVCGWYRSFEEALRDYIEAVKQWIGWAKENGLLEAARRLERHLASLEKEKLTAAIA